MNGKFFYELYSSFIDLLYPPRCILCNSFREKWLCKKCIEEIDDSILPFCFSCFRGFDNIEEKCLCSSNIICSLGYYEGILKDAICKLKYERKSVIANPLGELLSDKFLNYFSPHDFQLIIPVPLHSNRLLQRGFNQSERIAKCLSGKTGLPLSLDLVRTEDTVKQVSLSSDDRKKNVINAFAVKKRDLIKGKNILLVDDVLTTGATVRECIRVLSENGAGKIFVIILALSRKTNFNREDFVEKD